MNFTTTKRKLCLQGVITAIINVDIHRNQVHPRNDTGELPPLAIVFKHDRAWSLRIFFIECMIRQDIHGHGHGMQYHS